MDYHRVQVEVNQLRKQLEPFLPAWVGILNPTSLVCILVLIKSAQYKIMIFPPDLTLSYYITVRICKSFYRYFLVCKPSPGSDSVSIFLWHTGVLTVVKWVWEKWRAVEMMSRCGFLCQWAQVSLLRVFRQGSNCIVRLENSVWDYWWVSSIADRDLRILWFTCILLYITIPILKVLFAHKWPGEVTNSTDAIIWQLVGSKFKLDFWSSGLSGYVH